MSDAHQPSEALGAAGERRLELKAAVSHVEMRAAAPAAAPHWRNDLLGALAQLLDAFERHIDEVEREDGLLNELTEDAPRLVNHVDQRRDEHPPLRAQIAAVIETVGAGTGAEQVRAEVLDVLVAVARHRQKGADLVYEAYNVDIGGG
jgi:hypothetical protein